jgi:hypothetical protein
MDSVIDDTFGIEYGFADAPIDDGQKKLLPIIDSNVTFARLRWQTLPAASDSVEETHRENQRTIAEVNQTTADQHSKFREGALKIGSMARNANDFVDIKNLVARLCHRREWRERFIRFRQDQMLGCQEPQTSAREVMENAVTMLGDWFLALRLFCLESLILDTKKRIPAFQKQFVAEFGLPALEVLIALEKVKIIDPGEGHLEKITKHFRCFQDVEQMRDKSDSLAVDLVGCVPLTVRLVEQVIKDPTKFETNVAKGLFTVTGQPFRRTDSDPKNVLVFFVGGVTLAEEAAIRHLGKEIMGGQVRFLIGATNVLNSKRFLHEMTGGLLGSETAG